MLFGAWGWCLRYQARLVRFTDKMKSNKRIRYIAGLHTEELWVEKGSKFNALQKGVSAFRISAPFFPSTIYLLALNNVPHAFNFPTICQVNDYVMQIMLCNNAPLVLCCDRFDHGSRQVKHDLVEMVMEDYDIALSWRIH